MCLKTIVVLFCLGIFPQINAEKFSCEGRASGYYADVDTGCQVYHMCDGLGRQFSYSCPNTTLFQQRMLICDHWYMVSCSKSELDYSANLLIGQKDKPFVEDSSEHPYHRTPRPDLLDQPFAPSFQDEEARTGRAQRISSDLNLVGVATEDDAEDEQGRRKNYTTDRPQYFLPSRWSTQYEKGVTTPLPNRFNNNNNKQQQNKQNNSNRNLEKNNFNKIIKPSTKILPPIVSNNPSFSAEDINKNFNVINQRVDQGLVPDSLNQESASPSTLALPPFVPQQPQIIRPPQLPTIPQVPVPPVIRQVPQNIPAPQRRITTTTARIPPQDNIQGISKPSIYYQPPKLSPNFHTQNQQNREIITTTTTEDSRTFHKIIPEPARDLLPPLIPRNFSRNPINPTTLPPFNTISSSSTSPKTINKKHTETTEAIPSTPSLITTSRNVFSEKHWKELRQMFFIPEYDFPLDTGSRPSYDSGLSSFQVNSAPPNPEAIKRPNPIVNQGGPRGINPDCPKCDPAFLAPGTCKPCVMIR